MNQTLSILLLLVYFLPKIKSLTSFEVHHGIKLKSIRLIPVSLQILIFNFKSLKFFEFFHTNQLHYVHI
jgi:hypothetical protein